LGVVNLRPFIALILGLVIQLSQVPACWGGGVSESCAASAKCCCGPAESCPCATQGDSDRKPAPAIPPAAELKQLVLSALPDTNPADRMAACLPSVVRVVEAKPLGRIGYFGEVPLSVAFCRFVI
jgi:hypothetical protein